MKRSLLATRIALLLGAILIMNSMVAKAGAEESPAVVVWPAVIPLGVGTNFDITAAKGPTTVGAPAWILFGITVVDPDGDMWRLTTGGIPALILLPDMGDSIRLTWPAAGFSVLNDPDVDVVITAGALAWTYVGGPGTPGVIPHTLQLGTYAFAIEGAEGVPFMWYFDVSTFLVIPELPFGTIMAAVAPLATMAGLVTKRRLTH